ncbi:hemicentin-2-like [Varroa destructor]|uniref:Ig-like domain-containing protein n=1 Tax=Varroa destructor TaxID=109461 RepID=A0A7M7JG82_VARDE|nr:hemicentin-2-like [Varroa destructor]
MANHSKPAMMTVGAHLSIFVLILKVQVLCAIPPQIVPFKLPDDLEEGQRLIITCAIRKGTPPFVFFWQKNGRPLAETNGTRIVHNDDYQETLKIQTLGGDDVANYTCAVENAFGSDQISVAVLLKFKPRWNVPGKENSVITGVAGDSIMFDCSAIGYPTPAIRIFKGNLDLTKSKRIEILPSGLIRLNSFSSKDGGNLFCEAENSIGVIRKSAILVFTENLEKDQRLAVTCTVAKGSLPIAFTWRKDDEFLNQNDDLKLVHNDDYQETLQISKLDGIHVGNYTCAVKNAFGSDQMAVAVVLKFKPQWKTSPTEAGHIVAAVIGTNIELDCITTGHPTPTIRVFSDREEITQLSRVNITRNGLIRISSLALQDKGKITCEAQNALGAIRKSFQIALTGNYTCSAKNAFGSDQTSVSVVLKYRPRWITESSGRISAAIGEDVTIDCKALGHPLPTVRIVKGDSEVKTTPRLLVDAGLIRIKEVQQLDAGEFFCEASNSIGKVSKMVQLVLTGPPEIIPFRVPNGLTEGKRLTLMCSVSAGTPPISYSWLKDSSAVGTLPNVRIVHTDEYQDNLQIEKLGAEHVGNYTCNAKNLYGSDQMTVQIMIKVSPRWTVNNNIKDVRSVAGNNFSIDCRVTAHPAAVVTFYKVCVKIIHFDDFQDVLQIEKLSSDHVDNYTCVAKNTYGPDRMLVSVILKVASRWTSGATNIPMKIIAISGETVSSGCRAHCGLFER